MICGKREDFIDENRIRVHVNTKHKENSNNPRAEKRKRDAEVRKGSAIKKMKIDESEETPDILKKLFYFGRIKKLPKNNNLQRWQCNFKECGYVQTGTTNGNWKGLTTHVANHAAVMNKQTKKGKEIDFNCPYCSGKHKTIATCLRHLYEENCNELRSRALSGEKKWIDFMEENW